ncbi:hypothetical protein [Mesorhizobium sp. WSM4906]|uniref:hypothetical protein n=1 Tax=Mesorhizobium sp. WSM4906 TaxID=3038546 RepID=UPI002416B47B|nr:hypothetical protein [Mesorhizobium sp. WSM4906]WFP74908.1 hypothetical protein QAZ22_24720 [Mesorhizobium sp. WSM4906]
MRKLLLVSTIVIAAAAAMAPPAEARVFLGSGGYFGFGSFGDFYDSYGEYPSYGPYWGGPYYDYGPRAYNDYDGSYVARYAYGRHCRLERVSHWRHHHRVVERVRVCG